MMTNHKMDMGHQFLDFDFGMEGIWNIMEPKKRWVAHQSCPPERPRSMVQWCWVSLPGRALLHHQGRPVSSVSFLLSHSARTVYTAFHGWDIFRFWHGARTRRASPALANWSTRRLHAEAGQTPETMVKRRGWSDISYSYIFHTMVVLNISGMRLYPFDPHYF